MRVLDVFVPTAIIIYFFLLSSLFILIYVFLLVFFVWFLVFFVCFFFRLVLTSEVKVKTGGRHDGAIQSRKLLLLFQVARPCPQLLAGRYTTRRHTGLIRPLYHSVVYTYTVTESIVTNFFYNFIIMLCVSFSSFRLFLCFLWRFPS